MHPGSYNSMPISSNNNNRLNSYISFPYSLIMGQGTPGSWGSRPRISILSYWVTLTSIWTHNLNPPLTMHLHPILASTTLNTIQSSWHSPNNFNNKTSSIMVSRRRPQPISPHLPFPQEPHSITTHPSITPSLTPMGTPSLAMGMPMETIVV